jgi:hypothetical protein
MWHCDVAKLCWILSDHRWKIAPPAGKEGACDNFMRHNRGIYAVVSLRFACVFLLEILKCLGGGSLKYPNLAGGGWLEYPNLAGGGWVVIPNLAGGGCRIIPNLAGGGWLEIPNLAGGGWLEYPNLAGGGWLDCWILVGGFVWIS